MYILLTALFICYLTLLIAFIMSVKDSSHSKNCEWFLENFSRADNINEYTNKFYSNLLSNEN